MFGHQFRDRPVIGARADVAERDFRIDPDGSAKLMPCAAELIIFAGLVSIIAEPEELVIVGANCRAHGVMPRPLPILMGADKRFKDRTVDFQEPGSDAMDLDRTEIVLHQRGAGQKSDAPHRRIAVRFVDTLAANTADEWFVARQQPYNGVLMPAHVIVDE